MAKLKMERVSLAASMTDSKDIVDCLLRCGAVEISEPREIDGFYRLDTESSAAQVEKYIESAENAREQLTKYAPKKVSITASLKERTDISVEEFLKKSEKSDKTLRRCLNINSNAKTISDNNVSVIRMKTQIDSLLPWSGLDISFFDSGTAKTCFVIGTLPKLFSREDILSFFAQKHPELEAVEVETVSESDELTCVAVLCLKTDITEVDNALREIGFVKVSDELRIKPSEKIEQLRKSIAKLEKENAEAVEKIKSYSEKYDDIDFLIDYLIIRRDKNTSIANLLMSDRLFILEGFIPQRDEEKIRKKLEKSFDVAIEFSEPSEDEDVPVLLKNGPFSAPVESITQQYSLPSKDDVDPTPYMSFFYYFFFGMMLSDAGYGLIIAIATGAALLFIKMEEKMRNTCKMFFFCGLSTVFWGAMYGSWFGDIPNVIRTQFLGLPETRLYLWLDPLEDLMKLLVYCFLFGTIHLFFATGIKGMMLLKRKRYFDAFSETIPVYVAIIGVAPTFVGLFIDVPPVVKSIGTYVLIAGCVLVVATSGRASKGILGKFFNGLYGLYSLFSSYLGDVLSYSRLLALGLATGVIASVVNMLGTLPSSKVLKLIVLCVAFPVGHVVNLAINVLGAYVHANRLQFVEFFSRFYEGGGTAFRPFKANTKTYKFKEDS